MRSLGVIVLALSALTAEARFRQVEISHLGTDNFEFSGRLMLIKGEVHYYELPAVGSLAWLPLQTCGATYEAIVIEDLTDNHQPGERVTFSAPEEKELGSEWFVSLYSGNGRLMNDVVHEWSDTVAQQKKYSCESELQTLRSFWITAGKIHREWIPLHESLDIDKYQGLWLHRPQNLQLPYGAPIAVAESGVFLGELEEEAFQKDQSYFEKEIYVRWEFVVNQITGRTANKGFNSDAGKPGAG